MKALVQHVGAELHVVLPGEVAARTGWGDGAELVTLVGPGAAVETFGSGGPAFFAGTVSAFDVAELLSLLNAGGRTGVLTVQGAEVRRLYVRGGEIVFAASSEPSERLGEVLSHTGRLSRAQLEAVHDLVTPTTRLGQVLVQRGILTSAELFHAVSAQIKAIVMGLFDEDDALFLFAEGPVAENTAVKLDESTRDLVVAGIRRADERRRLAAQAGDLAGHLSRGRASGRLLTRREEELLDAFQDGDTVHTLLHRRPMGLFEGLRALAGLLETGALAHAGTQAALVPEKSPPMGTLDRKSSQTQSRRDELAQAASFLDHLDEEQKAPAPKLGKAFDVYRRAIQHVALKLSDHTSRANAGLASYFAHPPKAYAPLLFGVTLSSNGELDVERVLANANAAHGDGGRARALEVLESFLAFALFEARNVMPSEAAERLLQEVGHIQLGREI